MNDFDLYNKRTSWFFQIIINACGSKGGHIFTSV